MRILVAQIPMPQNRFLVDLNAEISNHCELQHDCDAFWNMKGAYDVIHLHFPEYLTFGLQDAYIQGLTEDLIQETAKRLEYWAKRAKLVVTRHVLLPHDALEDPMWEKMYAVFYRYADGVAHFAQASIDEFRKRYTGSEWFHGREPQHAIIPHHNYTSLPDTIGRAEARRRLGIGAGAKVMLVFGAIRNEAERQLILDTFHGLDVPRKLLLVSRWRERLRKISWIRLKYWVRDLTRLYYRLHPRYRFNYGFVEEEDTQVYLNAADVLFIPRLWVLNSGNITLGMTFGKVVVGPDSWDVGELLRQTGNPVFDPDRPETAVEAVEEGLRLAAEGKVGPANKELALGEWSADQCAALYVDLYRSVLERKVEPRM
jgi:hypothetical protein